MSKKYVMAVPVDISLADSIEFEAFLYNKRVSVMHGGGYNEYIFYTAELTDEELVYGSLKYGHNVKFLESKDENMSDIIVRIFNAGHDPKLSS